MSLADRSIATRLRRLVNSASFNGFIIGVILLNAVLIGVSTYTENSLWLRTIAAIESVCAACIDAGF
jgi:hypothetical protein